MIKRKYFLNFDYFFLSSNTFFSLFNYDYTSLKRGWNYQKEKMTRNIMVEFIITDVFFALVSMWFLLYVKGDS